MVLITYKTHTGTTKEAAEVINNVFKLKKFEVDLLELSEVISINKYDIIIIGAPINGMRWIPEVLDFVSKNEMDLKSKKVACFALSYIITDGRSFWKNRIIRNFQRTYQSISPIDTKIFGGRISEPMPAPARFIFGLPKGIPLDYRENKTVEQWAMSLIDRINS
jgi:menaquinone-dependent protoporphyrinogen IX oxidase